MSAGRIGWNAVTGSSDFAAMNFGMPGMPEHDLRYDMADEYMEVCRRLWGSWEPGAIIADRQSGMLVDHTKVHAVNYEGRYYRTRGPLNSGPCPQGQPVIAQAGGSPRGRQFAAQHADTIVAHTKGIEAMKAYRDDVRAHMVAHGRNPDPCKVLFLVAPIIGETEDEAQEKKRLRAARAEAQIPQRLAHLGKMTNIDFGRFDLDKPVPEDVTTNGHQQTLDEFLRKAAGGRCARRWRDHNADGTVGRTGRHAGRCRGADGRGDGGGRRRRLPVLHAERQPAHSGRDRGRAGAGAAGRAAWCAAAYAHRQFRDNLLEF